MCALAVITTRAKKLANGVHSLTRSLTHTHTHTFFFFFFTVILATVCPYQRSGHTIGLKTDTVLATGKMTPAKVVINFSCRERFE